MHDIIDPMNDMYREEILEHYREPQNFGTLNHCSISSKQTNPLCGDEIEMFIEFDLKSAGAHTKTPQGCKARVEDIRFIGRGCAISIASASLLTEFAKGKTKSQLTKFSEEDMLGLLGIDVSESRKKCALLGLYVLKDCLQ